MSNTLMESPLAGQTPGGRYDNNFKVGSTSDPDRPVQPDDLVVLTRLDESTVDEQVRVCKAKDLLPSQVSETFNLATPSGSSRKLNVLAGMAKVEEVVSVAAPVITMGDTGVFSIACDTAGATIYYTTNGSTPDSSSTQYTTPVTVNTQTEFRAIAIKGAASSPVTVMQVWVATANADGTKCITIRCKDSGQTISVAGGDAQLKLGVDGTWGNSAVIPAGDSDSNVYFKGGTNGGTFAIPNAGYVTHLFIDKPGAVTIFGYINGMALTYLYLDSTYTYVTGNITGMPLQTLYLAVTKTGITGTPSAIGQTLTSFNVRAGTSYNYPWELQTFGGTARTWTETTMYIDCVAQAPTVEVFDKWLKGLASVSLPGTATLLLKNTPTANDLAAVGKGQYDEGSGLYQMMALGYTMSLGQ